MNSPSATFSQSPFSDSRAQARRLAQEFAAQSLSQGAQGGGSDFWSKVGSGAVDIAGGLISKRMGAAGGGSSLGQKAMSLGESTWKTGFGIN